MLTEQALLSASVIAMAAYLILDFKSVGSKLRAPVAIAGLMLTLMALALRWIDTGRAPWGTLYESMVLMALLVESALAYFSNKKSLSSLNRALSALTIAILIFPILAWEPAPAISEALNSKWILIHVPMIIIAYSLFAISAISAVVLLMRRDSTRSQGLPDIIDNISNTAARAGLALLVPGIVLGAIWANAAWGSYWSWDPKETWALITAIIYALYVAMRCKGMKGEDAAYITILGFLSVIFTYIGISYLIPGLHSYA